jgi:regulator of RNase E activity RraA
MILEKIPFWSKLISHKMTEGRLRYVEKDIPVNVGGVTVYPGDMVVADGDGVIVVPRKIARDVAKHARRQLEDDKRGRRKIYEAIGRELDNSVK